MFPRAKDRLGFLLLLAVSLAVNFSFSSYVNASDGLEWIAYIGGNGDEILHSSIYTSDNCLLLVGESNSFTDGHYDVYIAKVSLTGDLLWNVTHSDPSLSEDDAAYQVIETSDGYLITGKICSVDGIGDDVLLLKLDKNGNKLWSKHYGGNAWDWGNDLLLELDNSILVAGTTQEFFSSPYDVYLLKFDSNGNQLWRKKHKISGNQYTSSIIKEANSYFILGKTTDLTNANSNIFLLKTDSTGHEVWYKEYGGPEKETASQITRLGDDYLIVGTTNSYGAGRNDVFIVKIDANGNTLWEKTIGSHSDETAENIAINSGTIILTCNTFKNTGNSLDPYLITLNQNGETTFNQTYGTSVYEKAIKTHPINQNTYYITGYKGTNNKDFSITKINLETHRLRVESTVGDSYGSGDYYLGATPSFGVTEETVYEGNRVRYLFTGWNSTSNGGYNGPNNPAQITVQNDITQIVSWQKQYYVEIQTPNGSDTSVTSGWFNEGDQITIHISIDLEFIFNKWEGAGPGSYTGTNQRAELNILGPITQILILEDVPHYSLELYSEYSETIGSGDYFEGTWVEFNLTQKEVYQDSTTRYIFEKWSSPSENGYNGVDQVAEIKMTNDVIENAVWKKQYFANITSNLPNADMLKTGWYDSGSEIQLFCVPHEGYKFNGWQGEGIGSYSGSESTFVLTLEAPIIEKTKLSEADSFVLRVLSDYGDVPDSKLYYEDTNVTLDIEPEIIYLSNSTRVKFNGWRCHSEEGYTGNYNPVSFQIKGDTIQEAVWVKQYYVSSSDSTFNQWFDENTVLNLPLNTSGILIPMSNVYRIDSMTILDSIVVSGPLVIQVSWCRSYMNLVFITSFVVFSGSVFIYRNHQLELTAKKSQIMNDVMQKDSLSLLEISSNYDLSYSKANGLAIELGQYDGLMYDIQNMTLYTYEGIAKTVEELLRDLREIEISRLAQILGIKECLLHSILPLNENIIIEDKLIKLV